MASIEIDMKEYDELKAENKALFQDIHDLRERHKILKQAFENCTDFLEEIQECSLVERLFKWKEILLSIKIMVKTTRDILNNDKGLID